MTTDRLLDEGRSALAAGRWGEAATTFEAALAVEESADALEGLADALWWQCDARGSLDHRERAWVRLRRDGEVVRAGRAAIDLCLGYLLNLGNDVAARGWLGRAQRVLEGVHPNPLQGWLLLMSGYMAADPVEGHALTTQALEWAREQGDADVELVALADLGLESVAAGRVEQGLAMLDEAMAGSLGGERRRLDTVVFTTCTMLAACQLAGDLDRVTKWCQVADDFMTAFGSPFLFARCRTHYGAVLLARGHWAEAEIQLRSAIDLSADAGPGPRAEALCQLADLRTRQGRLEEAEALLSMAEDWGDVALAASALRLARGEAAVAVGLLERRVKALGEHHIEAVPTLAMLVDALIADGRLEDASSAVTTLEGMAQAQGREPARALAARAAAAVAIAGGDRAEAVDRLEHAVEGFTRHELPLEAARARVELARMLGPDQAAVARVEAARARDTFDRLGARFDADATRALLRSLGDHTKPSPSATPSPGPGVLTPREREVLALLGLGLSNPEIAARLFVSRKTASHHVSNVLAKLGVRNRAEAAARAVTLGLAGTADPP